jgi:hypothetical protein
MKRGDLAPKAEKRARYAEPMRAETGAQMENLII